MIRYGWSGVDLFFILSGYLIGKKLWDELSKNNTIHYRKFLLQRALRIVPLYFFYLMISFLFFREPGQKTQELFPELFFVSNYFDTHFIQGSWSLSIEEQFYWIAPLFLMLLNRFRFISRNFMKWAVLFLMVPSLIRWISLKLNPIASENKSEFIRLYIQRPFYCHFDSLWLGIVIASQPLEKIQKIFLNRISLFRFSILFILTLMNKIVFGYLSLAVLFGVILVWGLNRNLNFRTKTTETISKLSYGMYLNHLFLMVPVASFFNQIIVIPEPNLRWTMIFLVVASLSTLISKMTYQLIEKPILTWRNKITFN